MSQSVPVGNQRYEILFSGPFGLTVWNGVWYQRRLAESFFQIVFIWWMILSAVRLWSD